MSPPEESNIARTAGRPAQAAAAERVRLAPAEHCDACGSEMRPMGHCKYQCLTCGFLLTCHDLF